MSLSFIYWSEINTYEPSGNQFRTDLQMAEYILKEELSYALPEI